MKKLLPIACIALAACMTACSLLQAVALKDCNYSYNKVSDITICGLSHNEMLTFGGIATITKALLSKTEPLMLGMKVHVNVENPNQTTAALNQLYYKVALDNVEIAEGNTTEPFSVPGGTTAVLPLQISTDLRTTLTGDKKTVVTKAIKNMAGIDADPSLVTVQIRPSIRIGSGSITSPTFIPISFEYSGKNGAKQVQAAQQVQ